MRFVHSTMCDNDCGAHRSAIGHMTTGLRADRGVTIPLRASVRTVVLAAELGACVPHGDIQVPLSLPYNDRRNVRG